jgi:hypothetical protein
MTTEPRSRNTWSGAAGSRLQAVRRVKVVQPVAKPSPGFRQAAPAFDSTVRSVQPHWPSGVKSWFACTESQYVPGESTTSGARSTSKSASSPP